ncbi:alpha/beta hydrolase [Salinactinospora qingdaonensis]|uniref:alpha/beta hydrolase n=1 Tax=Salinactinospora qingdaonensis TaxID=702744 RepID=UPI0031E5321A
MALAILRWGAVLVALLLLAEAISALLPILVPTMAPESAVFDIHTYRRDLYVLPFPLLAAGAALLAGRLGARRTSFAVVTLAGATALVALVPTVAVGREAGRHEVGLSLHSYFAPAPDPAPPTTTVDYVEVEGHSLALDVHRPATATDKRTPAVVRVHGGGWVAGSRGQTAHWNRWLTQRGYTVFDIDYRLAPPARWRDAPGDVTCAVGWVKEHAADYGIDPGRVVLSGSSAGGHLALMAAYDEDGVAPSCDVADTSVKAVMAFYPVTDIGQWWDYTPPKGGDGYRPLIRAYTGGSPSEVPQAHELSSPTHYARPGLPPTLLLHGRRDHTVPHDQSSTLVTALQRAGTPVTLVSIPYAGHVFDARPGSWGAQLSRGAVSAFLRAHVPA